MRGKSKVTKPVAWFLYSLYSINSNLLRRSILSCVKKIEVGEIYSSTLRRIYSFYHGIHIGMYSYGGCFSLDHVPNGTIWGRYCSIAANVTVLNGNHPLDFMSLHPFFYNPALGYVDNLLIKRQSLTVENDVWIGRNVTILPSVSRIENSAAIGAGSVVTKDVPAFAVLAGNPARIMRYRFSEDKIRKIVESSWWDKDIDDLQVDFASFILPYR
jgi:virginiamycin A acetyltransferase